MNEEPNPHASSSFPTLIPSPEPHHCHTYIRLGLVAFGWCVSFIPGGDLFGVSRKGRRVGRSRDGPIDEGHLGVHFGNDRKAEGGCLDSREPTAPGEAQH